MGEVTYTKMKVSIYSSKQDYHDLTVMIFSYMNPFQDE